MYHTRSNLWNVLIIGMQDFNYLIPSKSWNKEKTEIPIVRTGNFYSVLLSPANLSLARATNSLHLGIFNPP